MKRDIKILLISFALGALVMLLVHMGSKFIPLTQLSSKFLGKFLGKQFTSQIGDQAIDDSDDNQSGRLTSVGIPHVVELDPKAGEKPVLMNDPSIQKNWGLNGTHG